MSLYGVKAAPSTQPLVDGCDALVAQANSTAEAKALAQGRNDGDSNAVWGAATVVDMASVADLTGWGFRVAINTGTPINVLVTGVAGDTLDTIGAKLVTALNATAINASAYNTSTNVLTVAGTADGIGDKTVTVTITPPTGLFPPTYSWAQADVVASKTDGGSSGAALVVTFSTTWVVPGCVQPYKQLV